MPTHSNGKKSVQLWPVLWGKIQVEPVADAGARTYQLEVGCEWNRKLQAARASP